mmetsp:Transcript_47811/g.79124  ORF Transcript_47811/g.79124 Transcript_47811/m.79124 type:complete len:290 (+) Transcript_47811:71-940(+)
MQLPPPIPWLPLLTLCHDCVAPRRHTHEPHNVMRRLLQSLGTSPKDGVYLDVGPSFDMADGLVALQLGFRVLAVEARKEAWMALRGAHKASVASGQLTLIHRAVTNVSRPQEITLFHAHDSTSLSQHAASKKKEFKERTNERVLTSTLDELTADSHCAAVKLDIQGFEHEALLGASQLLRRPPRAAPLIIFELMEALRPDLPGLPTLHWLRSFGYVCYDVTSRKSNALPDGSLRHAHRCCSLKNGTTGACSAWLDDAPKACMPGLYSDFVCHKPSIGRNLYHGTHDPVA